MHALDKILTFNPVPLPTHSSRADGHRWCRRREHSGHECHPQGPACLPTDGELCTLPVKKMFLLIPAQWGNFLVSFAQVLQGTENTRNSEALGNTGNVANIC